MFHLTHTLAVRRMQRSLIGCEFCAEAMTVLDRDITTPKDFTSNDGLMYKKRRIRQFPKKKTDFQ